MAEEQSRRNQIIDRKITHIESQMEYFEIEKEYKEKTGKKTDNEEKKLKEFKDDLKVLNKMKD